MGAYIYIGWLYIDYTLCELHERGFSACNLRLGVWKERKRKVSDDAMDIWWCWLSNLFSIRAFEWWQHTVLSVTQETSDWINSSKKKSNFWKKLLHFWKILLYIFKNKLMYFLNCHWACRKILAYTNRKIVKNIVPIILWHFRKICVQWGLKYLTNSNGPNLFDWQMVRFQMPFPIKIAWPFQIWTFGYHIESLSSSSVLEWSGKKS